jgi:hypothetical protein
VLNRRRRRCRRRGTIDTTVHVVLIVECGGHDQILETSIVVTHGSKLVCQNGNCHFFFDWQFLPTEFRANKFAPWSSSWQAYMVCCSREDAI